MNTTIDKDTRQLIVDCLIKNNQPSHGDAMSALYRLIPASSMRKIKSNSSPRAMKRCYGVTMEDTSYGDMVLDDITSQLGDQLNVLEMKLPQEWEVMLASYICCNL